ncbi:hypothetical protein MMC25_002556 [Agyrium rufum]|nr:hypothetical protein [Agyrium rufum]
MLSILRKARLKDKEMRILMLGLDNAGKTTIVKRIMNEDVNTVSPTLGFIIKTIDFEGYQLNIWDVGGQRTLRSYWRNYFEKTDALIWVVDATDKLRLADCKKELSGLLLEETSQPRPKASLMAATAGPEDIDVNEFIASIRALGETKDREDQERAKRIEDDILKGRKERRARREERARSISPTKDSLSNSSTPVIKRQTPTSSPVANKDTTRFQPRSNPTHTDDMEVLPEPSKQTRDSFSQNSAMDNGIGNAKDGGSGNTLSRPSGTTLSRTGTLSWQQRPTSRGSPTTRSRPLSMVATENSRAVKSPRATPDPTTASSEAEPSRTQIAQALGSKDPTWFRQTQDRAVASAAFRKNQVDEKPDDWSARSEMRLPGLSRESTAEPERESSPRPESVISSTPSREGSFRASNSYGQRYPSTSSSVQGSNSTPFPLTSAQKLDPPTSAASAVSAEPGSRMTMSPAQGRISPERGDRPASPTKGLGGFVQSAMLKRSDSQKRWSAQPGLSRGNSVASNRSGYDGSRQMGSVSPPRELKRPDLSREPSPTASSRPGSSHGQAPQKNGRDDARTLPVVDKDGFVKPALPEHSKPILSVDPPKKSVSPPPSPSKAIDSKKWSPTKASWLESAINKPESPRPVITTPQQPSWMTDLNKAKTQRGSVDLGKPSSFKEVTVGGLLRSPPMNTGVKSTSLNTFPSISPSRADKSPTPSAKPSSLTSRSSAQIDGGKEVPPEKLKKSSLVETEELLNVSSNDETEVALIVSKPPKPASLAQKSVVPLAKPKPETPPKKDFRANLKPRQVASNDAGKAEPEFKNVFGNLKRAETKNYVAPDELKGNILRGKAGLSLTGGPKKTERRDDFKDSILKKKEEMTVGTVARAPSAVFKEKVPDPIPEALAKRSRLGRSGNSISLSNATPSSDRAPSIIAKTQEEKKPLTKEEPSEPEPSTAEVEAVAPSPATKQPSAPARLQREPVMSSKLADRFNPALLGILSRGPPSNLTSRTSSPANAGATSSSAVPSSSSKLDRDASDAGQLTHITKSRARGPKRKAPSSKATELTTPPTTFTTETPKAASFPLEKKAEPVETPTQKLPPKPAEKPNPKPLSSISNNTSKLSPPSTPLKPSEPVKKAMLDPLKPFAASSPLTPSGKESNTRSDESMDEPRAKSPPVRKPSTGILRSLAAISPTLQKTQSEKTLLPDKPILEKISEPAKVEAPQPEKSAVSVRGAAGRWMNTQDTLQTSSPRARSPIKLPTKKDEEERHEEAGLRNISSMPVGLGIRTTPSVKPTTSIPVTNAPPSPPLRSRASPPPPAKKPDVIKNRLNQNSIPVPTITPQSKYSSATKSTNARRTLEQFFPSLSPPKPVLPFDTPSIISARSHTADDASSKIKTLRKQIVQLTSSGKTVPLPSDKEHILSSQNLYLCTHVFGSPSTGTRTTETYLWCGDAASPSAIDDAQLFARRVAKDNSGKLVVLKQGKETSEFFQALGGIVITRKGESEREYMLCGRRHVGQIAFDEVPLEKSSLCSGFPFIVSTKEGKLWLWKGVGSGADELGCARLIGMDLGLTGEIEEVDEGKETNGFWNVFPSSSSSSSSSPASTGSHWSKKPSCSQYAVRLFSVEVEEPRPKSSGGAFGMWGRRGSTPAPDPTPVAKIEEIHPFAQSDFSEDDGNGRVFVLDTFFEIFVILPRTLSSLLEKPDKKFAPFHTALLFAQEYAILTISTDDRPGIPATHVVLSGAPPGMRSAFRKWIERREDEELVVLGLDEAIDAVGR